MPGHQPRNIEDVLAKLTSAKRSGDHWTADCPVPGHKTPAGHLSIKDVGRLSLVTCHPGNHTYQEICAALGFASLTYHSNGSKPQETPFPKLSDDEAMALLKQSYGLTDATIRHFGIKPDRECWRYPVKGGFRYKKYSRQGPRKYWHDPGTPNQLYGLADIPEGTREILLTNGEPAVWTCFQAGIPAVCGIYGEGQLPENAVQQLKAKGVETVNVPADLDQAGKAAALKECQALKGIFPVRIQQLPDHLGEKADVADLSMWCGGNREAFQKALAELPDIDPATLEKEAQAETKSAKERVGEVRLIPMVDVVPQSVSWLWHPYIPQAKLTLLEGDPGVGKSWVSLAIATAVSLGHGLPGRDPIPPGKILLASAEDGLGDTIRPRLDAMGADVANIFAIEGALDFANGGLAQVLAYIEKVCPLLVIIDPLVAFIGSTVDIFRANQTRAILAALADIAAQHQCAIVAARHLTKGGMMKAIYRGLGSIDFTAACRSVLLAGCDPEDSQKRGLVHIKSNLAPMGPPVGYELRDGRFFWKEHCDLTAAKILAAEDSGEKSALDEAIDFLKQELADGPVDAEVVWKDARRLALSEITVKRAKASLGVITRRQGEPGKRGGGKFTWELPREGDLEAQKDLEYQEAHIQKNDTLNQNRYENSLTPKNDDTLNAAQGVPALPPGEAWEAPV